MLLFLVTEPEVVQKYISVIVGVANNTEKNEN